MLQLTFYPHSEYVAVYSEWKLQMSDKLVELPCPAAADCAVRIVGVAVQCVRAKHRFGLSFWISFCDSPNHYQAALLVGWALS